MLLAAALATLSGCATPVFKDAPPASAPPAEVAGAPERYHGADVVWGGKILAVRNQVDTTEVQVVAYPLDRAQRPKPSAPTEGRFIVVLPGYAEALDYPAGRFLTVHGHIEGTRAIRIDDRDVVYPLLQRDALRLWPANFPDDGPHFSFGFGVGVGIH
ncbi:Slp family lipoprotein [Dokdonella soli]|uniref:Slp family lipoprotein n=1 Tax=Dokdonella soli TaxID=529810 RepID=A0ABN1IZ20_9GAMM